LSQLEDGLSNERRIKETGTRKGGFSGGIGGNIGPAQVSAKADKSNERAIEEEQTRQDTTPARFARLEAAMEEMSSNGDPYGLNELAEITPTVFDELRSGAIVGITCDLEVSQASKMLRMSGGLTGLMEVAAAFGADVSDEDRRKVHDLESLSGEGEGQLIAQGYIDEDQPVLALSLKTSWILGEVEGEAHVVGKISGKWNRGEYRPLFDLPGMAMMNRKQRRAMAAGLAKENPESNEMLLPGPGLALSVLAIYR
jgi:hypothetical protein